MTDKTKKNRGGAREGAGRKSLYGGAMTASFTVRVNDDQGAALGEWCTKNGVSPATLVREVGLLRAGVASLGLGLRKIRSTAEKEIALVGAAVFPVKCTEAQASAIRKYCEQHRVAPGTWLREAALEYIGKKSLGLRGQSAALDRAL